ncbi:MAG: hypothetical protein ISR65_06695 [Bacteriovoracaceae bacterium]|nr:hypothetical protein [Bacteriovoracaceae bacterium]
MSKKLNSILLILLTLSFTLGCDSGQEANTRSDFETLNDGNNNTQEHLLSVLDIPDQIAREGLPINVIDLAGNDSTSDHQKSYECTYVISDGPDQLQPCSSLKGFELDVAVV